VHSVPFLPSLLFQPTDLSYGKAGESLTKSGGNLQGNPKNLMQYIKDQRLKQSYPESLKKNRFI